MHLDPLTLMVAEAIASAISSMFLFGAWLHFRDVPALKWWSAAHTSHTVGLILLIIGIASKDGVVVPLGAAFVSLAPILIWAGVRRFFGLRAPWPVLIGAPMALPLTSLLPLDIPSDILSAALGFTFWPVFLTVSSWLLIRNLAERLPARWSLVGILMIHSAVFTMAVVEVIAGEFILNEAPRIDSPFGIVHFESLLFSIGSAFLMILICRERHELKFIEASRIDPLTGSSNRSALFETAERLLHRDHDAGTPSSLIMFDLDRFKSINDNHGHQFGDQILREFAETVRLSLRPRDVFGRYGGEEFVVILPGTSATTAALIAERIRKAFADANAFVDGMPVKATVSAGVATANGAQSLETLIRAADEAMYAAKRGGRDRVEVAPDNAPDHGGVVRIA
jgi:diguanylate cyclase (GGDEF)-like protein